MGSKHSLSISKHTVYRANRAGFQTADEQRTNCRDLEELDSTDEVGVHRMVEQAVHEVVQRVQQDDGSIRRSFPALDLQEQKAEQRQGLPSETDLLLNSQGCSLEDGTMERLT